MQKLAATAAAACGSLGGDYTPQPPTRIKSRFSSWVWAGVGFRGGVGFGVGSSSGGGGSTSVCLGFQQAADPLPFGGARVANKATAQQRHLNCLTRHFGCLGTSVGVGVFGRFGLWEQGV